MARTKTIVTKIQNEIVLLTNGYENHPESHVMYCDMIRDVRSTINGLYYIDVLSESEFHKLCEFFDKIAQSVGMSYYEANHPYPTFNKE